MLRELLAATAEEVWRRQQRCKIAELQRLAEDRTSVPLSAALTTNSSQLSIIAEFKRSSPNGDIALHTDLVEQVQTYEKGGASAISILTSMAFQATPEDLAVARNICQLPLLAKDFFLSDYQVYEAAAHGASGLLLLASALEVSELQKLHDLAIFLGLDVLLELHTEQEFQYLQQLKLNEQHVLIGLNNRNLDSGLIDLQTAPFLKRHLETSLPIVAESGYDSRSQLVALEEQGFTAVLIGSSLMKAEDAKAALLELRC